MIRIQRNLDPSVIYIVFDRIFNQIGNGQRELYLVNLRADISVIFILKVDISLLCKRHDSLDYTVEKLIYISLFKVHGSAFTVSSYKREKIVDDLGLSVHLIHDVRHEIPVILGSRIFILEQRLCKNLHGCNRCLQLMADVRYKFLSRRINRCELFKHRIVVSRKMSRLPEALLLNLVVEITLGCMIDLSVYRNKPLYSNSCDQNKKEDIDNKHSSDHHDGLP